MVPFSFAGEEWLLGADRALYWPRQQALLVADLHLEKASFFARHGQMLPPYDSRATLERVYAGLAPALKGAAALSVLAHLEDLVERGLVHEEAGQFLLTAP